MARTLNEKREQLAKREQELREELDLNSEDLREKAKQVGKIALISGGVALIGFWAYKAFFESEEEGSKKKAKKRKKAVKSASSRLAEMALPFVGKMLDNIFKEEGSTTSDHSEVADK